LSATLDLNFEVFVVRGPSGMTMPALKETSYGSPSMGVRK
jgi:hypothetical protein